MADMFLFIFTSIHVWESWGWNSTTITYSNKLIYSLFPLGYERVKVLISVIYTDIILIMIVSSLKSHLTSLQILHGIVCYTIQRNLNPLFLALNIKPKIPFLYRTIVIIGLA